MLHKYSLDFMGSEQPMYWILQRKFYLVIPFKKKNSIKFEPIKISLVHKIKGITPIL
jgi:hypothetical protein